GGAPVRGLRALRRLRPPDFPGVRDPPHPIPEGPGPPPDSPRDRPLVAARPRGRRPRIADPIRRTAAAFDRLRGPRTRGRAGDPAEPARRRGRVRLPGRHRRRLAVLLEDTHLPRT